MPSSKTVATGAAARVAAGAEKCTTGAWKANEAEARDSICAQAEGGAERPISLLCAAATEGGSLSGHAGATHRQTEVCKRRAGKVTR